MIPTGSRQSFFLQFNSPCLQLTTDLTLPAYLSSLVLGCANIFSRISQLFTTKQWHMAKSSALGMYINWSHSLPSNQQERKTFLNFQTIKNLQIYPLFSYFMTTNMFLRFSYENLASFMLTIFQDQNWNLTFFSIQKTLNWF